MNQLQVSLQYSIVTLSAKGWSARKIARELGVHRETVGRYLHPAATDSKPAIPPTGSWEDCDSKPAIVPTGSKAGRTSQYAPLSEVIKQGLLAGLSAQRIYQDLVTAHAFPGGYSVMTTSTRARLRNTELSFLGREQGLIVDLGTRPLSNKCVHHTASRTFRGWVQVAATPTFAGIKVEPGKAHVPRGTLRADAHKVQYRNLNMELHPVGKGAWSIGCRSGILPLASIRML